MVEEKNTVKCPQCSNDKARRSRIMRFLVIYSCVVLIIPIIGWLGGIIGLSAAWVFNRQIKKDNIVIMRCLICKHRFRVKKADFEEYQTRATHPVA
ncbi:hypothetical protein ASG66_18410 [Bacillus sp. Leaf406]|nr:hypothetical protein ASG66_18410 [Bacillus sp. Leaf406]